MPGAVGGLDDFFVDIDTCDGATTCVADVTVPMGPLPALVLAAASVLTVEGVSFQVPPAVFLGSSAVPVGGFAAS